MHCWPQQFGAINDARDIKDLLQWGLKTQHSAVIPLAPPLPAAWSAPRPVAAADSWRCPCSPTSPHRPEQRRRPKRLSSPEPSRAHRTAPTWEARRHSLRVWLTQLLEPPAFHPSPSLLPSVLLSLLLQPLLSFLLLQLPPRTLLTFLATFPDVMRAG